MKWIKTYGKNIVKWILFSILLGILGGLLGTAFHMSVDYVTEQREHHSWFLYLLPLGGLLIAAMYHRFRSCGNLDTKRVFQAVKEDKDVPLVMIPLIFIGTVITHAFGGSAGREGAALQLGGSMGYNVGQALKQEEQDKKLMVMAGMSSVFSALFGTPFTAAIFSVEVTRRGKWKFSGLFPCVIASLVAFLVAQFFGVEPVRFLMPEFTYNVHLIWQVLLLAVLCAGVCILFALALHKTEHFGKKLIKHSHLRALIGGLIIIALTLLVKTTDYNGAGMGVIENAILGTANYEAFLLKILFTAITVAAGFKGGEIVPTFFIGATFGCVMGALLGLPAGVGACLGFVALFSGMTKCPVAAFLLAMEVFDIGGILLFIPMIVITWILSGKLGLYQK